MDSNKRMIARLLTVLVVIVWASGAVSASEIYQSTDEHGAPVFSDRAPTDAPAEKIRVTPAPPLGDAERAVSEAERANRMADQMGAERVQKQQARQHKKEAESRQKVACAASQSRLTQLTSQPPNRRLVIRADGSATRVSSAEMQRLVSQARAQVAKDCQGVSAESVPASSVGSAATSATSRERTSSAKAREKATASTERNKASGGTSRNKTE